MNNTIFIGIDVSKSKLDVASTHNGKEILSHAIFENDLQGFKKLIGWVKKQSKKSSILHYCMEPTGIYSEDISEYLQDQKNTIVSLVNPARIKSFAATLNSRSKNDKIDAQILALFAAILKPEATPKIPDEIKKFKRLVRYLDYLIDNRAREKSKLESVKDTEIELMVRENINFYTQQIKRVEKSIKKLVNSIPQLKEDVKLVDSIPSIGFKTACNIVAEIHYCDRESLNPKSEVAHAGLTTRQKISGTSVKGKSKICKQGNSYLRKCLYMPAMNAVQFNPLLKEFYARLISNNKLKIVALVAVMKKMLAIAVAILKNRKPFDPNWAALKQQEFSAAF